MADLVNGDDDGEGESDDQGCLGQGFHQQKLFSALFPGPEIRLVRQTRDVLRWRLVVQSPDWLTTARERVADEGEALVDGGEKAVDGVGVR
jgi:hypothetical protein